MSPDGKQIACVLVGTGTRQLALVPIEGGAARVLMPDAPGLAFTPAFSPDGRLIAYSRWKPGGYRDIHIYDLAAATDRAISVDRAMDIDPRFSPDGRYVLFSSDRSGINDIYAYELSTRQLWQVTNLLSGAFQPVGLARQPPAGVHRLHQRRVRPLDDAVRSDAFVPAKPYANARLDSPVDPDAETDSPDAVPEDAAALPFPQRVTPYVPWKYMYPHQWTFGSLGDVFGLGQTFQVLDRRQRSGRLSFLLVQLPLSDHGQPLRTGDLQLSAALAGVQPLAGEDRSHHQRAHRRQPQPQLPAAHALLLRLDGPAGAADRGRLERSHLRLRLLGLRTDQRDPGRRTDRRHHHQTRDRPVRRPELSWSFSNAHRWQYSISNQEGRGVSLNLRLSDPTLGGRFRSTEVSWSWTEYFTPPWARLHALALITQGGFGIGDKRQFFGLGGYASQDVLRGVLLNQQQFAFLRGYPVNVVSGDSYLVASGEYRAPLLWIERGYQTFPLYLRRIWGTGFVDAGDAFQGPFHPARAEGRRGGRGAPRVHALLLPRHADPARLRARASSRGVAISSTSSRRSAFEPLAMSSRTDLALADSAMRVAERRCLDRRAAGGTPCPAMGEANAPTAYLLVRARLAVARPRLDELERLQQLGCTASREPDLPPDQSAT